MHPAASVIIFTTLSGMGFGAMTWLSLGTIANRDVFLFAALLAMALACAGLLASTFHLGNPQRAWRAFSQWRSSWLSREGILSVLTLALFSGYALSVARGAPIAVLGILAALAGVATVFATAMIYAQLKTVPRWHHWLTPACYAAFALAGGALWTTTFRAVMGEGHGFWVAAFACLVVAWGLKLAWWARADKTRLATAGSTPETATGLGALGKVDLLEPPHTSPNYLMKEMVYRIGRKHARKLRRIALSLGAVIPAVFLLVFASVGGSWVFPLLAVLTHLAGVFAERWLFFAEAEHVISLYYGHR